MLKYCIIDENNKVLSLTNEEAKEKITYILNSSEMNNNIICFEDRYYEYIEINFSDETVKILKDITKYNHLVCQNSKLQDLISELRKENKGLRKDNLTKLYRADCAMKVVRQYILYAYKMEIPFSLVMADIDKFKNVNDTYGHEVGNLVLENIGKTLLENVRTRSKCVKNNQRKSLNRPSLDKNDIIIRYGGEEILILIKNINLENTIKRIEEIRTRIENMETNGIKVTMSFGIFNFNDRSDFPEITKESIYQNVTKIVQCADRAMYNSKKNGRNRTSIYDNKNDTCYIIDSKKETL